MEILTIRTFHIKSYELIPWGSSYSMKCSFSHASTYGLILKNSYKLFALRAELESSFKAKCSLKSWRYLVVVHPNGTLEYYEANSNNNEPAKVEADLIPLKLRISPLPYECSTAIQPIGSHLPSSSVLPSIFSSTKRKDKPHSSNKNDSFTTVSL